MKILKRILILLAAFSVVMGIIYVVVNAGNTSVPVSGRDGETGPRLEGAQPQVSSGERPEFHHEEGRGGGWIIRWIRNGGILAVIVALITIPKNIRQKRKKDMAASTG